MPLYEFRCVSCNNVVETIISYKEKSQFKVDNCCALCQGEFTDVVSKIARTQTLWGDETGKYGVNGMFSKSLGRHVTNRREEERIAKSMGFVPESDLPKGHVDEVMSAQLAEDAHFDKLNNAYQKKVKEGGNTYGAAIAAVTELLPAKDMLAQSEKE